LGTADSYLESWLPQIMAGPDYTSGRLAIVVTADEDDRHSGNVVLTAVIHPGLDGAHKVVATPLTHYSLTRLYDQVLGTPLLRNAASAPDMAAAFGLTY
jgi:acid phosphatase